MAKVLIGISGGVDSSVGAYLLKKQGYEVEGVHFILKKGENDATDARAVCSALGIKLHEVDFSQTFSEKVFSRFISEYENGLTPNLCVMCNQFIKFGALSEFASSVGADYVATGHYCSTKIDENGRCCLLRPIDLEKDQTYFLNQVKENVLKKTLFPLSSLTKPEVRKIAESVGLITAHKKGSSDICLMGDMTFRQFIAPYVKARKGKIISDSGEVVGEHDGLFNYTLGQRKGLGLGGKSGESGRWFVISKNAKNNSLCVSHGSEELLYSRELEISSCNWIGFTPEKQFSVLAKTRYRQELQPATVFLEDDKVLVKFNEPQRAITEGQFCVFYSESQCLGGGKIENVSK